MRVFLLGGPTRPRDDAVGRGSELATISRVCRHLGSLLAESGYGIVVCSPFPESVDYEALQGVASSQQRSKNARIEFFYPDHPNVNSRLPALEASLEPCLVDRRPCAPLDFTEPESQKLAWLLAQLSAFEHCTAVLALGGREGGSTEMLLRLASDRSKPVLPLPFLAGAAGAAFARKRYELQDILGREAVEELAFSRDASFVFEQIKRLTNPRAPQGATRDRQRRNFFISYARARPAEADHLELILRRRNLNVLRDERDIEPGHDIPQRLRDFVQSADVFIAVWCAEYAASPWCADELELALSRHQAGHIELWLLCVDNTRIVPRAARTLRFIPIKGHDEMEAQVALLLEDRPT